MESFGQIRLVQEKDFVNRKLPNTGAKKENRIMTKVYQLDEKPTCLECGKLLDEGPARDYVVWYIGGKDVSPAPQDADCGHCDARFTVSPRITGDKIEIVFKNRH
jgi:hypothetical protein